mmetsp:Transcript_3555/g.7849  ORF Transcript_3555/g.7849 Transcript_3555/m.7849 type:complete len:82 (+) Transcript_3555:141-386(+)
MLAASYTAVTIISFEGITLYLPSSENATKSLKTTVSNTSVQAGLLTEAPPKPNNQTAMRGAVPETPKKKMKTSLEGERTYY